MNEEQIHIVDEDEFLSIVQGEVQTLPTLTFHPSDWQINTLHEFSGRIIWRRKVTKKTRARNQVTPVLYGVIVGSLDAKTSEARQILLSSQGPVWLIKWAHADHEKLQCHNHSEVLEILRKMPFAHDKRNYNDDPPPPPSPILDRHHPKRTAREQESNENNASSLSEEQLGKRLRGQENGAGASQSLDLTLQDSSQMDSQKHKLDAAKYQQTWSTNDEMHKIMEGLLNQYVWWKFSGKFLPGKVVDPSDPNPSVALSAEVLAERRPDHVLVLSFDDFQFAWTKPKQIELFKDGYLKHAPKAKGKSVKTAIRTIIRALQWDPPAIEEHFHDTPASSMRVHLPSPKSSRGHPLHKARQSGRHTSSRHLYPQ